MKMKNNKKKMKEKLCDDSLLFDSMVLYDLRVYFVSKSSNG